MKYFGLFLLTACSLFQSSPVARNREIAHIKASNTHFEVALTQGEIFPNGMNATYIKAKINIPETIDPKFIEVVSNGQIDVSKFTNTKGVWIASIRPESGSEDIDLYLQYKGYKSPTLQILTFNTPIKDKIEKFNFSPTLMQSYKDITYSKRDDAPEGIFDGFQIYNYGPNRIAPLKHTKRDFLFSNDEFASQNMSFQVTDAPNEFTSHLMLSEFMLFPRHYLYNVHPTDKETHVTLPTGEKIVFNKDGEIIDGVFEEGPIDISGDRFKRHYADLKYKGKGILLRANARGQMPQQGQFESTKIDMEYGIKYSADVLIINGTTGQRCRRPKADFWTQGDVSVIAFKFPTDKEFNQYLKSKCGFEIPNLNIELSSQEDISQYVDEIWNRCENAHDINKCVHDETKLITSSKTRNRVKFELQKKINQLQKKEEIALSSVVEDEALRIEKILKDDFTWVKDSNASSCLSKAKGMINLSLRFHDSQKVMTSALGIVCEKIKDEIKKILEEDSKKIYEKTKSDLSWVDLTSKASLVDACLDRSLAGIEDHYKFSHKKDLYSPELQKLCKTLEQSQEYTNWLKENTSQLDVILKEKALTLLNKLAQERALKCVADFPVTSSLERIKFKRQREDCLYDHWPVLEKVVLEEIQKDPLVARTKYSTDTIAQVLSQRKRSIQLGLIKQYFN